jgi:hypothetical protein
MPLSKLPALPVRLLAWGLAQSFAERRRYHEQLGRPPIEMLRKGTDDDGR